MNGQEFLQKILPSTREGTYIATIQYERNGNKVAWNKGFATIEALMSYCEWASGKGMTAYFALGVYIDNVSTDDMGKIKYHRKALMARAFSTLAFDLDCGPEKPYQNAAEGAQALTRFIVDTKLPAPLVNSSGYGLHCYWPLTEEVTKDTWIKYSEALKKICAQRELHIDTSKISDPAMVLRPVGTYNWKNPQDPKLVRTVCDRGPYHISLFDAPLGDPTDLRGRPVKVVSAFDGITFNEPNYAPAISERIVARCQQVREIVFNGGAKASEREWYGSLGIAAYCEEPEITAVKWSQGYIGYDYNSTLEKMRHWREGTDDSPASCAYFQQLNPLKCNGCKYAGKVKSPIILGRPEPEKMKAEDDPTIPHPLIDPPQPYARTVQGITVTVNDVVINICEYDLFPSHISYDPKTRYEEAIFYWKKPHKGYVRLQVRLSFVFNDSSVVDLNSVLADNGLLIANKANQIYVAGYMKAYIQSLQRAQETIDLRANFGWSNDNSTFLLGSTEFRKDEDEVVRTREVAISKELTGGGLDKALVNKGSADIWRKWTKLFSHPQLAGHGFILGAAFAAPLIKFTALSGYLMSIVGDSGSGKSTMQLFQQSVYGCPSLLALSKEDKPLAVVTHMGRMGNLPITIDECTRILPATLCDFTYWATQGRDRKRQTDIANPNGWALPVTTSSNKSLRDKIVLEMPDDDAILMRIIEFVLNRNPIFDEHSDVGRQIAYMLNENYGHSGRLYIAHLMKLGAVELRARWDAHIKDFQRIYEVEFTGKERFWMLAYAITDLGLRIAQEAGVIEFEAKPCTEWALAQLRGQRTVVKENLSSAYDLIGSYVNCHIAETLTVDYSHSLQPNLMLDVPQHACFVRRELYRNKDGKITHGFLYVEKAHFRMWMTKAGADVKKIVDTMEADSALYMPNSYGRISMGKDTKLRLGQVAVIGINLSHPNLRHMLDLPDVVPDPNDVVKISEARRGIASKTIDFAEGRKKIMEGKE